MCFNKFTILINKDLHNTKTFALSFSSILPSCGHVVCRNGFFVSFKKLDKLNSNLKTAKRDNNTYRHWPAGCRSIRLKMS